MDSRFIKVLCIIFIAHVAHAMEDPERALFRAADRGDVSTVTQLVSMFDTTSYSSGRLSLLDEVADRHERTVFDSRSMICGIVQISVGASLAMYSALSLCHTHEERSALCDGSPLWFMGAGTGIITVFKGFESCGYAFQQSNTIKQALLSLKKEA